MEIIRKLFKSKAPIRDIISFFEGTYRYWLYYRTFPNRHPLIRQHIWEQISYRIAIMNPECYNQGSCIKCGCNTTALQMAGKTCDGLEYPPMVSKDKWRRYINCNSAIKQGSNIWIYNEGITNSYIETPNGFEHKVINTR